MQSIHLHYSFLLLIAAFCSCLFLRIFFNNFEKGKNLKSYLIILFFVLGFCRFYFLEKQNTQITELLKTASTYTAEVINISDYKNPFFKHKVLLKLSSLIKKKTKFKINVYLPKLYGMRISDRLTINELKITCPKSNQGSLYSSESITPKLFASTLSFTIAYRPNFSFLRWFKEKRYNLSKQLSAKMSKASSTLFEYIFLGLKNPTDVSEKLRYKFNYWGIAHYLARSGLHVVMIIFLWSLFLKILPFPFILKQLILTLLSLAYSLLSWPSTSFERALITFLLVQICYIMKWPFRSSYLITLCSLLFLIINPLQLFILDFQLSFGLALGISLFNEMQNKKR